MRPILRRCVPARKFYYEIPHVFTVHCSETEHLGFAGYDDGEAIVTKAPRI